MKKIIILVLTNFLFLQIFSVVFAGKLIVTAGDVETKIKYKKAYFAGGCFWCMEETFDKLQGVIRSTSGYSGGHLKNPTYKEVIYKDTGHVETIEIT